MVGDHDNSTMPPEVTIEVNRHSVGPLEQLELVGTSPDLPRPFTVSVFLLGDTLIDSGSAHTAPYLVEALRERPPKRIVLTHQHEDHVGGLAPLRRAFGEIPIYAPRNHHETLLNPPKMPFYRAFAWGQPERVDGVLAVEPGDRFEDAGFAVDAIPTPGHTPGHLAYVLRLDDRVLAITGDLYLGHRPTAGWYESAADDMRDSARLLAGLAESVTLCPSHGPVREEGRDRLMKLADWVDKEIEAIVALSKSLGTRDYGELVQAHFGGEDHMAAFSNGEFSHRCFVRAVLDPVRTLPAEIP